MKYKVLGEIRYNVLIGTFDAETPKEAMAMAEKTHEYYEATHNARTAGLWDVLIVEEPSNAELSALPKAIRLNDLLGGLNRRKE
jgi:hypothetical protein